MTGLPWKGAFCKIQSTCVVLTICTVLHTETSSHVLKLFGDFLVMNFLFSSKAPIEEENKCWKINVTIEYGNTSVNNVSIARNQALGVMKKIAGTARARLFLCRDVTVKLRDVQVTRGINVTYIMGVFHLVPKEATSKFLSSSAIKCFKGAGIFMDLKTQPARNAPKLFGAQHATGAVATYYTKGLCCADGLVESNGICGE